MNRMKARHVVCAALSIACSASFAWDVEHDELAQLVGETLPEEIKSFFIRSLAPSSSAISLMVSTSSPISSLLFFSIRTSKLPEAIFRALRPISPTGITMDLIK